MAPKSMDGIKKAPSKKAVDDSGEWVSLQDQPTTTKKKKTTKTTRTRTRTVTEKQALAELEGELSITSDSEPVLPEVADEIDNTEEEIDMTPVEKPTKKSKKCKGLRIFSRVVAVISAIIAGVFIYRLATTNVLPPKYFYPALAGLILLPLIYLFFAFKKRTHKITLIILDFLAIVISAVAVYAIISINTVFGFLKSNIEETKQYAIYNVIVNKGATYNSLEDLHDKRFTTAVELQKDVSDDKLEETVKEKISGASLKFEEDIDKVMGSVLEDKTAAIIVNSGTYGAYVENTPEYEGKVRILESIEIEIEGGKIEAKKHDLTNSPFVMYISGIDTRTGKMPTRSLSDVNITAVVNPKSKNVLLVSIPRDSYVQLHGTTGLKDKLTHAGSKGGVALSMATLQDLYGIEYDRYIRVNFNFVKKLVDAIDGITINSDVNYPFTTLHEKCYIKPGLNNINGSCAIGFARERYAYEEGDRHRGENQLQVIEKVFDKATSGSTILTRYSQILDSLNGTFDTNLSMDDITSLVRMQLDDMAKWTVKSISVTGKGAKQATYSYPNQQLYTMNIDEQSLQDAIKKMNAVLAE